MKQKKYEKKKLDKSKLKLAILNIQAGNINQETSDYLYEQFEPILIGSANKRKKNFEVAIWKTKRHRKIKEDSVYEKNFNDFKADAFVDLMKIVSNKNNSVEKIINTIFLLKDWYDSIPSQELFELGLSELFSGALMEQAYDDVEIEKERLTQGLTMEEKIIANMLMEKYSFNEIKKELNMSRRKFEKIIDNLRNFFSYKLN